jgi:hypothetical protein
VAERPPNIHQHGHGGIKPPAWPLLIFDYSLLPVIRWPLGYDIVHPKRSLVWALLMVFGGFALCMVSPQATIGARWYFGFVACAFILALVRFAKRALGQKRGEEIHTQEAGYSVITRILFFLPAALTEQMLTPAALAYVGWVMAHAPLVYWGEWHGRSYYQPVSVMLGWWLFISAFSYLLMARWEYSTRWSQQRQVVNRMKEAKIFGDRLNMHEEAARQPAPGARRRKTNGEPDVADIGGTAKRHKNRVEPDFADLADPPDYAGFAGGSDSAAPDTMGWFRRRRT